MGERNPNPTILGRNRCGESNGRWTGERASYFAVHLRLKHFRGSADCYDCVGCGAGARQWAYDQRDAEARIELDAPSGAESLVYSVKLSHYIPLCLRCHLDLDGTSAGARQSAKTHCPQGHPYDARNTGSNQGYRRCKTCHRDRERLARRQ